MGFHGKAYGLIQWQKESWAQQLSGFPSDSLPYLIKDELLLSSIQILP